MTAFRKVHVGSWAQKSHNNLCLLSSRTCNHPPQSPLLRRIRAVETPLPGPAQAPGGNFNLGTSSGSSRSQFFGTRYTKKSLTFEERGSELGWGRRAKRRGIEPQQEEGQKN